MAINDRLNVREIANALKSLKHNIKVPGTFVRQVNAIDTLIENDKTGIVTTVVDLMVNTANVPIKIETGNKTLNSIFRAWQEVLLNGDINLDIPRGLEALSTQYFRERWRSSFIGLNVIFEEVDLGENGKMQLPTKMWFVNGSAIHTKMNKSALDGFEYKLKVGPTEFIDLESNKEKLFIIRKPYNLWHQKDVVPFLLRKGVLFNALLKTAIVDKQADVINVIIPYLLTIKSGSDKLAELGLLATEPELKALRNQVLKVTKNNLQRNTKKNNNINNPNSNDTQINANDLYRGNTADLMAYLSHDVNFEHLMPDLTKIFDPKIVESVNKNLMAGLGLVEMEAFSKTRKEAFLNPKILVEEVKDAVKDWSNLLQEVLLETIHRNRDARPKLTSKSVNVIPGTVRAFITDPVKQMLRSMYDRGIISKQSAVEEIVDLNFEVEIDRTKDEAKKGLDDIMYPPVIQNLEQHPNAEDVLDDRKPGTPEADNFNQAILNNYAKMKNNKVYDIELPINSIFDTIDELPDNVKNVLPVRAQMLWLRVFNDVLTKTKDEERAFKSAWSVVSKQYKKVKDRKKWVKIDEGEK